MATDPYSSTSKRPFDDDVLDPLKDEGNEQEEIIVGTLSFEEADVEVQPAQVGDVFASSETTTPAEAPASNSEESQEKEALKRTSVNDKGISLGDVITASAVSPAAPVEVATIETMWDEAEELIESQPQKPKKRWIAHILVTIATIIITPIAWYLLSDSSIRLGLVEGNPWVTGNLNIAAIGELIGAFVVVAFIWWMATASTLGVQLAGIITMFFGFFGLFVPVIARNTIVKSLDYHFSSKSTLLANIVHHLGLDWGSGRFVIFGFFLFITGVAVHIVRKRVYIEGKRSAYRQIQEEKKNETNA
ncbi:MAG: hypothetical protein J6M18_00500 [Actinomycetaceae bacterium]|nr:hypothetical protein [Actinomycetaceae bacterium]